MSRAVNPSVMPELPEGASRWRRSTRRAGGVFHALRFLGDSVCGRIVMDANHSIEPRNLGDFHYFGVCPACFRKHPANKVTK